MRKLLLCATLIGATAALGGCGINDYDPPEGITIVTTPTTTRPIITGLPTTVRPTTTKVTTTTTVVPPPAPPVVTTVIVVPLPPPVVTTTVTPPPPPPARPAPQTVATGSTIGQCGGTRLVMDMPINNVPITLTSSGLHFESTPSIPIESVIVQTANPTTSEFRGYVLPLSRGMIGTGNRQSLDFSISAPEAIKAIVLCDAMPQ